MRFEATVEECIVSQGEIPKDLAGGYYRVGPTWKRPTKQGTNPLLSMDGMVQAITFENGRADFRNRWVRTPKYLLEEKHRRGMFAWMGRPAEFADPSFEQLGTRFASPTLIPAIARFFADKSRAELEPRCCQRSRHVL